MFRDVTTMLLYLEQSQSALPPADPDADVLFHDAEPNTGDF